MDETKETAATIASSGNDSAAFIRRVVLIVGEDLMVSLPAAAFGGEMAETAAADMAVEGEDEVGVLGNGFVPDVLAVVHVTRLEDGVFFGIVPSVMGLEGEGDAGGAEEGDFL